MSRRSKHSPEVVPREPRFDRLSSWKDAAREFAVKAIERSRSDSWRARDVERFEIAEKILRSLYS